VSTQHKQKAARNSALCGGGVPDTPACARPTPHAGDPRRSTTPACTCNQHHIPVIFKHSPVNALACSHPEQVFVPSASQPSWSQVCDIDTVHSAGGRDGRRNRCVPKTENSAKEGRGVTELNVGGQGNTKEHTRHGAHFVSVSVWPRRPRNATQHNATQHNAQTRRT
jgi:hypothetical protein